MEITTPNEVLRLVTVGSDLTIFVHFVHNFTPLFYNPGEWPNH